RVSSAEVPVDAVPVHIAVRVGDHCNGLTLERSDHAAVDVALYAGTDPDSKVNDPGFVNGLTLGVCTRGTQQQGTRYDRKNKKLTPHSHGKHSFRLRFNASVMPSENRGRDFVLQRFCRSPPYLLRAAPIFRSYWSRIARRRGGSSRARGTAPWGWATDFSYGSLSKARHGVERHVY